jgi:hypothetical protein
VEDVPDAAQRIAAAIAAGGARPWLVAETTVREGRDSRVGIVFEAAQQMIVILAAHTSWCVLQTAHLPITPLPADDDAVTWGRVSFLLRKRPTADEQRMAMGYDRAAKLHALAVRNGRPSQPPDKPLLVCLVEQAPSGHLDPLLEAVRRCQSVAFFRQNASGRTLVTWSVETPAEILARWRRAAGGTADVIATDNLPQD